MNDLIENATILTIPEDHQLSDWKQSETAPHMSIYSIDPSYCEGDTPLFI